MAYTLKLWEPGDKVSNVKGLVQALKVPPSTWHIKEATPLPGLSLPPKLKLGVKFVSGSVGCLSMVVSGAMLSTTQEKGATVKLPTLSVTITWKV